MLDKVAYNPDFEAITAGYHSDPFSVLGPHATEDGNVIRAILPGALEVIVLSKATGEELTKLHPAYDDVLFEGKIVTLEPYILKIFWPDVVQLTEDSYAFPPTISDFDLYLLGEGRHYDLTSCLGARVMEVDGVAGVRFSVWAPNARRVSVVGNFNAWDGRRHAMRRFHDAGVWEIFIPRLAVGEIYKYEILGASGVLPLKADPLARQAELPPKTGSIVLNYVDAKEWSATKHENLNRPLSIYEVHVASWMRHYDGRSYNWIELSERLIPYVKELGFTHIELLPIMGHPFGGSWGYQPLSQYAPMPEMGSADDFELFVARCHEAGLGVILDFVPAHFPSDLHGLAQFDGTALYEHADPREGFHQDWNTLIYNFGRNEVRCFLISAVLYWLKYFAVDGIRVDAVASMLYRDYSRKAGEWIPNQYGGRENLEAIRFIRELSSAIAEYCPGALLIAEESTAWPGVTADVSSGGLGFTHKWNMGWMHDSLSYIQEDPINRPYHHDKITFGLVYAFSEKFVLPISHDEVVHGKKSLLGRMPGDEWQKFANLRAYFGFMWTHPGKKLIFMGCEFGQVIEWNHDSELSWNLLQNHYHQGAQATIRELNHIYQNEPSLYERDFDPAGFQWLVGDDRSQSVVAYIRYGEHGAQPILVVCNFTPMPRYGYSIGVPEGVWSEVFNSDSVALGGSGIVNGNALIAAPKSLHGMDYSIDLTCPPLATIILKRNM